MVGTISDVDGTNKYQPPPGGGELIGNANPADTLTPQDLLLGWQPGKPQGYRTRSFTLGQILDLFAGGGGVFLPVTGGTLTGPLALAADPTLDLQAATKRYVDSHGGGGGGGNYVDITTPTYTTLTTDGFIAVNSAAPVTITLAAAPALGARQTINDIAGHGAAAHITIQPTSGTIMGFANVILTQNHQAQSFTFTSLGWVIS